MSQGGRQLLEQLDVVLNGEFAIRGCSAERQISYVRTRDKRTSYSFLAKDLQHSFRFSCQHTTTMDEALILILGL